MKLCVSCAQALSGSDWACRRCGWRAREEEGIVLFADPQPATLSFPPDEFATLHALESEYFWFQERNRLILWAQ